MSVNITPDHLFAQATELLDIPWLKHGCTTREFSPPDANRPHELQHLRRYLELSEETPILHAEQKHTKHVAVFKPEDLEHLTHDHRHVYRQTDGIVTMQPGLLLAILTADCAPIFIVDRRTRATALVHAGWKGTFGRIGTHAVQAMLDHGSKISDLTAWIGPMIAGCCYEVSPELIDQFTAEFQDATAAGIEVHQGRHLDLVAINAFQLRSAGIPDAQVHRSEICTLHRKDTFYSYRGDSGTTGRIISTLYASPD